MGLFEPKWMHKNEDKALSYVEQLQDESKLVSAALDSPHEDVCMVAARKLKSDDALLRAMKGTKLRGKRRNQIIKEMIDKLQDKSRLKEYMSDSELIIPCISSWAEFSNFFTLLFIDRSYAELFQHL